jgi:hypothetical protein
MKFFNEIVLGGILTEYFVIDALYHLIRYLLANLNTCIVCSFCLVVAGVSTFIQTFYKLIHVGSINAEGGLPKYSFKPCV